MMRRLRRLMSLDNLSDRRTRARGQIMTLGMLVVMFLLILTFMGLSLWMKAQTALKSMNAADAAALMLASQNAVKGNNLADALGGTTQKCKTGPGWLVQIVAVIVAVLLTIFFPELGPVWIAIITGAFAAVTAVALGGNTSQVIGAFISGFSIGLMIANGAEFLGNPTTSENGALIEGGQNATVEVTLEDSSTKLIDGKLAATAEIGTNASVVPAVGEQAVAGTLVSGTVPSLAGAIIGGTLGGASAIYNEVSMAKATAAQLKDLLNQINGLNAKTAKRLGAAVGVLSQTVTDPNMVSGGACYWDGKKFPVGDIPPDVIDTGGRDLPCLAYWLALLVKSLKDGDGEKSGELHLQKLVQEFIDDVLVPEADFLKGEYKYDSKKPSVVPLLARKEIEGASGALEQLAKSIYNAPAADCPACNFFLTNGPFIDPTGPTLKDYQDWMGSSCSDAGICLPPPKGWDSVDAVIENFKAYGDTVAVVEKLSKDKAAKTWEEWTPQFYDGGENDFYNDFTAAVSGNPDPANPLLGVTTWQYQLMTLRTALPPCAYVDTDGNDWVPASGKKIASVKQGFCKDPAPPCADFAVACETDKAGNFATSDTDLQNEFAPVEDGLEELRKNLAPFPGQLQTGVTEIATTADSFDDDINPLTYHWSDLGGGAQMQEHKVTVESHWDEFKLKTKKSSGIFKSKVCVYISPSTSHSKMKVTLKDVDDQTLLNLFGNPKVEQQAEAVAYWKGSDKEFKVKLVGN